MRSRWYRGPSGDERLWLEAEDIETMMVDELVRARLFPSAENPAVDIETFIYRHLGARMDQHAELDADVLGQTEFCPGEPPRILVNRDLTGAAIDDDDPDPGILGRWRATLAHEASHVVVHRILFELDEQQGGLFSDSTSAPPQRLMRCLKRNVLFRGGGSDWREVQANRGMAALLMPQSIFRAVAAQEIGRLGLEARHMVVNSPPARRLATELARLLEVSNQAAGIRLETLGMLSGRAPLLG